MKFLDFASLLDKEPAKLAALSTFQFDADFFERRLLRCTSLAKARRILIFMDSSQWFKLLRQDVPARFLNRRYLVVPVRTAKGVFHPKLNLLVGEDSGQVLCGSNNLTRAGCSSNLELLNSFSFSINEINDEAVILGQEAFAFFRRACEDADQESGRIARQWLEELSSEVPWLSTEYPSSKQRSVQLVHTFEGSLWDRVKGHLNATTPRRMTIISPFFDKQAELVQRIRQQWAKCQVEIIVQQKTTNLSAAAFKKLGRGFSLSELRNSSRRLHAKLLAWESAKGTGCLVGSANFTTAAFDARNVEACLLVTDASSCLSVLFDGQLQKRPLTLEDFDSGSEQEPEVDDSYAESLQLISALLSSSSELRVTYRVQPDALPEKLRLAVRIPGEQRPRSLLNLPIKTNATVTLGLPESALNDAHGTILVSLVAEDGNKREESPAVWVIQEDRLTYEPIGGGPSNAQAKIEESGEGLTELLEELGKRDGIAAVVEYLRNLNIRFNDGGSGIRSGRMFRIRIRDPFHADIAPEWLLNVNVDAGNLTDTIYEFVDRHQKRCLRKHASRGNVNGMENFLDIFTALVRLLYIYHVRGYVNRLKLIGRFCEFIQIAICGFEETHDSSEGYLFNVSDNLGDSTYLQEVCTELNFLGQVRAAFAIVQRVRFVPGETAKWSKPPSRPSESLPDLRIQLRDSIKEIDLCEPSKADIMKALGEYKMFSASELADFEKELVF